jgi:alkaline phosphatase D
MGIRFFYCILALLYFSESFGREKLYCDEIEELLKNTKSAFPFGVATGDPHQTSMIFWTAINPYKIAQHVPVILEISTDITFSGKKIEVSEIPTFSDAFSVKFQVDNLLAETRYFYRFKYNQETSIVGQTKTLSSDPKKLRLIVASCSNWEWGFFNAYKSMTKVPDVDAVIHLGDYIYEYEPDRYGKKTLNRKHLPAKELITLQDYRSRYAQYHLDPDLQAAHQVLPFITIWDDHEIANDSYTDGAENHQEQTEGGWEMRKAAAQKAYFEWLPITKHPQYRIRRKFNFGSLADLYMLDERMEGRSKQPKGIEDPVRSDSARSMLGIEQRDWLLHEIQTSTAKWKILGNQVIFSAYDYPSRLTKYSKSMDMWEGYPVERNFLLKQFYNQGERNLVVLTGDIHASFSFELRADYRDPKTAIGVEWTSTSISSASINEYMATWKTRLVERMFKKKGLNPHVDYINFRDHGFLLVTFTEKEVVANWYFEKNILKPKPKIKRIVTRKMNYTENP